MEAYNTKCFFFLSFRATIEEVEGDVCELESKLDKVSTTHGKHCMIVHALHWETNCFCGNLVKSWRFVRSLFPLCYQWLRCKYICAHGSCLIWGLKEQEVCDKWWIFSHVGQLTIPFFSSAPSALNYTTNKSVWEHESVPPIPIQEIFTGVRRRLWSGFIICELTVL